MRTQKYLLIALSFCLLSSTILQNAAEARARGGGGGGRGVMLQTPNPTTPVEHNNRGVELGQKGIWPDAIREHEIALQMDPHNTSWRTNLSAAHLEYGKYLAAHGKKFEAGAEYRRAMIIDPANAQADAELDNVLRSLKRNPDEYDYRRSLADDADVSGQYDTSIVEWRKCIKIRNDPYSHSRLGAVLIKAGKTVEGYKELRTAVGMSWPEGQEKELADTHRQLGDILKDFALKAKDRGAGSKGMQRLYNAAVEYRRAVTIYPGNGGAIEGLLQCGQMALAIKPSFDNHLYMGAAYVLAGKFPNAQMEYNECYKLKPNRPELSTARVAFHQAVARSGNASQEQVADSVAKVKKLIDDDSENARLWYILGRLREAQSDYEKAKKCYDKAAQINPLIDKDLKQALVRIGATPAEVASATPSQAKTPEASKEALQKAMKEKARVELEQMVENGDNDNAITKGQEAFTKDPKDGSIAGIIGRAFQKKGDANSAKSWYRIGSGLGDSNSTRFLEEIDADRVAEKMKEADGLFKDGKIIDAKSIYQDVIIMAPKRADVHRKVGDCMKAMGDTEGAKKEYDDADRIEKGLPPLADAPSDSDTSKKSIAGNDKGKEPPKEEGGMKADSLEMKPLKKKK